MLSEVGSAANVNEKILKASQEMELLLKNIHGEADVTFNGMLKETITRMIQSKQVRSRILDSCL